MRRAVLQLEDGGGMHAHQCELCGQLRTCGAKGCELAFFETCGWCASGIDCPSCYLKDLVHVRLHLRWDCSDSTSDDEPIRTCYTGSCGCGYRGLYVDLHDGRGPLYQLSDERSRLP